MKTPRPLTLRVQYTPAPTEYPGYGALTAYDRGTRFSTSLYSLDFDLLRRIAGPRVPTDRSFKVTITASPRGRLEVNEWGNLQRVGGDREIFLCVLRRFIGHRISFKVSAL